MNDVLESILHINTLTSTLRLATPIALAAMAGTISERVGIINLALEAMGDRMRAASLFAEVQHLRLDDGSYWTGYVYPDDAHWPVEQSTFTAGAVVLAADALADLTAGADIMRGRTMVPHFEPVALECGCDSLDRVPGRTSRSA